MKTLRTIQLWVGVLLLLLGSAEATELGTRVAFSGDAQFSGADVPENGPALVAWRSTDQKWSKVTVLRNGETTREWDFQDLLVKGARWVEVGERFLTHSIGDAGPISHLYSIREDGGLALQWTSAALEQPGTSVIYSGDGRYWLSSTFSETAAQLSLGTLGETEPVWQWHLAAREYGEASPLAAEQYSYSFFLADSESPPEIGILWGARLWLARPFTKHLVRVMPPKGCDEIHAAFSTAAGLWAECHQHERGTPGVTPWAYYAEGFESQIAQRRSDFVEEFRAPRFQPDGTILDMYRREGLAGVYELSPDRQGLMYRGNLEFPAEARVFGAGDSLLVEIGSSTDEFRVLSLQREVARLRKAAARANQ